MFTVFRLKKLADSFFTFMTVIPKDLAQSWIHIHAVRQEKCSLLDMTSIDINNIRTGRPCPVLGFHDQIASLALYCGADTDLLV